MQVVVSGFHSSIPISETLSYLTLQSTDFSIFQTENRGVYYDGNSVVFQNSDGMQSVNIVLSKVFKHTYDLFDLRDDELKFTDVNGRELAVFHYKNENGAECYLHANLPKGTKTLPISEWAQEYATLSGQRTAEYTKLKETRAEVTELHNIRKCVDIALRADQPEQTRTRTKRHEQER